MVAVNYSLKWFVYKDLYPLKEKSPVLCIVMIVCIAMQLLIFPTIFFTNYLTDIFRTLSIRYWFRAVQMGLDYSVNSIYFLRCIRLFYAHQTNSRNKGSLPFKLFSKENVLAAILIGVGIIRYSIV